MKVGAGILWIMICDVNYLMYIIFSVDHKCSTLCPVACLHSLIRMMADNAYTKLYTLGKSLPCLCFSCFIIVENGNPFSQRCIFYSHTQAETMCIWNVHWITPSVYTVEDNSSTIQLVVLFVSTYYLNVLVYMFFEQHSESLILWM